MVTVKKSKRNRTWAILIGIGLAITPIHNKWVTELVTDEGVAGFFIPSFGYVIWMIALAIFAVYNWERLTFGDKKVYIPLLIIVSAIGISGITAESWIDKFVPLFMGLWLFTLYLAARILGKNLFIPLAVGAGIASFGVMIAGVFNPGKVTGGLIFEGNYDIVVGYVLLGAVLFVSKYQWQLASLALLAMVMSGSPEAVFATAIIGIAVLCRKDWGKKLVIAVAPVILVAVAFLWSGYGQQLYSYAGQVLNDEPTVNHVVDAPDSRTPIGYRIWVAKESIKDIQPLGYGYSITEFREKIVHNVPLIIMQQLGYAGIIAGMAWLFVIVYCLIKTKWKYAFITILALSVFDHYIWTQLAPYTWAIIGVATSSDIKSDLVFKEVQHG